MKNIALIPIIVLAITVISHAQTVQRNSFLKSHVVKGQYNLTTKTDDFIADSLTIGDNLMIMPLSNDLYNKINNPFKTARTNYLNATAINHKILLATLDLVVYTWYTNKYNIDQWRSYWQRMKRQQPLDYQYRLRGTRTIFNKDNHQLYSFLKSIF